MAGCFWSSGYLVIRRTISLTEWGKTETATRGTHGCAHHPQGRIQTRAAGPEDSGGGDGLSLRGDDEVRQWNRDGGDRDGCGLTRWRTRCLLFSPLWTEVTRFHDQSPPAVMARGPPWAMGSGDGMALKAGWLGVARRGEPPGGLRFLRCCFLAVKRRKTSHRT